MYGCLTEMELDRYHAQDLNDEQRRRVETHLAQCRDCARRSERLVTDFENLLKHARRIERQTPPYEFPDREASST
jgi:anti-sigma factor RsiW